MKHVDRLLAEKLLSISAIQLQPEIPFVWSSGWNSPIYTDNRKTLSYPEVRNFIKEHLNGGGDFHLDESNIRAYDEGETAANLYCVEEDTVVLDNEMIRKIDDDLDNFLKKLMEE